MLCSTCRTRPPVTGDGRCALCAQPAGPAGAQAPYAPAFTAPQQWLRSPDGLAKTVVVLLAVVVVADLLAVAADVNIRSLLGNGPDNGFVAIDEAEADRADMFYAGAGVLQFLATVATAVAFIMWFWRVRANAGIFDASVQPMRPGWAIGGWFMPVAGLWLPRRIAGGIWVASAPTHTDGTWRNVSQVPVNLWWGAWVVSLLFGRYASRQYDRAEMPQEIANAASQMVVSDLLDITAAVFAVLFVRELTRMQGERAALGMYPLSARP
ncbi:DUF4328 domain-containing protein [Streptomyces sp. NBC_01260]|uniref:DUF4328 domain-containing protein n=1 Tax=unclassified Streptomyces TaxID=2593676 RepID=UPI000FC0CE44|nr:MULTISPECIES: DUF4328 domain-containing protein [unclassified Streptomyces]RPK44803.1 hypothetical protein EES39_16385 [Streptomyces sp. ADI92-24]